MHGACTERQSERHLDVEIHAPDSILGERLGLTMLTYVEKGRLYTRVGHVDVLLSGAGGIETCPDPTKEMDENMTGNVW